MVGRSLRRPAIFAAGLLSGWFGATLGGAPPESLKGAPATAATNGDVLTVCSDGAANGGQVVYVLDPRQKAFSIYSFDAKKEKLRLSAVRRYAADQQLAEYNNEQPSVADIERLTRQR